MNNRTATCPVRSGAVIHSLLVVYTQELHIDIIKLLLIFDQEICMAKRATALRMHKKSKHSHKTKKRLEIKRLMLLKKATKKKFK